MKRKFKIILLSLVLTPLVVYGGVLVYGVILFEGMRNAEKCIIITQVKIEGLSTFDKKFYQEDPKLERVCENLNPQDFSDDINLPYGYQLRKNK